jgi:hypothetical protein
MSKTTRTSRRTWQQAEGRAAALFGCRRAPGSGSSGRDDAPTCSDSTHSQLYLESKLRQYHAARALHDVAKKRATREGKVPVLALFSKNRPGFLLAVHSDDLPIVLVEYAAALSDDDLARFEAQIREARTRTHPEASMMEGAS